MSSQNFIKNITSKDINLSKNTILQMVKSVNIEDFSELCQKSDFIFPFLKERIINDFVKLINKENLNAIFEFSKIELFVSSSDTAMKVSSFLSKMSSLRY